MKKLLLIILVSFFLTSFAAWAMSPVFLQQVTVSSATGNDFSNDPNCVALWRFESGALTTDSKGTNTLTNHNTVTEDTSDYKEGSCSADLVSGNIEYFSITDTDLNSGFPFRAGDGTPNDDISVCFWIKPDVIGNDKYIFSKYDTGVDKRTFGILIYGNKVSVIVGYNGGVSGISYKFGTELVTDKWYHVGITFQNGTSDTSSIRIRIWDYTAGDYLSNDYTTSSAKTINIEDSTLYIGDREGNENGLYDGNLDELVVFKDILSTGEIDKIRGGAYP